MSGSEPMPVPSAADPPRYVRTPTIRFLASIDVDRALARADLAGSIAHAEMLERVGLLTADERAAIVGGLRSIGREIAEGTFAWEPDLEDVHTNIEVALTRRIGPIGGKLHTARSRNDQIALDERLYLRAAVRDLAGALLRIEEILLRRSVEEARTAFAGYTHLQRAQPITLGHHLLAHFWRLDRDLDRLYATARRANVSPLGAGALAGSTLPIDPTGPAARLGFDRPFENSVDAVSDRDPFAELVFDLALLAVHLSSIGEELVLWSSAEFGFIRPTPVLGGGSSLMPQKQNPDVPELVRARAARVVGDLVALLTMLKGLPLAYDRDLQEDKGPTFRAVATTLETLGALAAVLDGIEFDRERIRAAARDPQLLATDAAEALVTRGVPFRRAHEAVGSGTAEVDPAGRAPIPVEPFARRSSPGAPGAIDAQIALARTRLASRAESLSSIARLVAAVDELVEEKGT